MSAGLWPKSAIVRLVRTVNWSRSIAQGIPDNCFAISQLRILAPTPATHSHWQSIRFDAQFAFPIDAIEILASVLLAPSRAPRRRDVYRWSLRSRSLAPFFQGSDGARTMHIHGSSRSRFAVDSSKLWQTDSKVRNPSWTQDTFTRVRSQSITARHSPT